MDSRRQSTFPVTGRWPIWAEYVLAIGLIFVAVFVRLALEPLVGEHIPFLVIFIVLMPLMVMVRPGAFLAAALTGLTLAWFFVLPPRLTFDAANSGDVTNLIGSATLALAAFGATWMLSMFRTRDTKSAAELESANHALRQSELGLRNLNETLEAKVAERTVELEKTHAAYVQESDLRANEEQERIELLRRVVTGQEAERERIGRDIHDHVGQRLTAFRLQLESLKAVMKDDPAGQTATFRVQTLDDLARLLDTEVSYLAWELRPTTLDQFGLVETLRLFVQEWSKQCGIPGEFEAVNLSKVTLEKDAETHLYRITQEALNNIAKHAAATRASVHLSKNKGFVSLIIEDDGCGFVSNGQAISKRKLGGMGLSGMHERASLIGGTIEIDSQSGEGTTIFVRIPQPLTGAATDPGDVANAHYQDGRSVSTELS